MLKLIPLSSILIVAQWAREHFDAYFVEPPTSINTYLTQPDYIESAKAAGLQADQLKSIATNLNERPLGLDECITWARKQFEEDYANEIKQLLYSLPPDLVSICLIDCVVVLTEGLPDR